MILQLRAAKRFKNIVQSAAIDVLQKNAMKTLLKKKKIRFVETEKKNLKKIHCNSHCVKLLVISCLSSSFRIRYAKLGYFLSKQTVQNLVKTIEKKFLLYLYKVTLKFEAFI